MIQPILVIYTGGTIGMEKNPDNAYSPTAGFEQLVQQNIAANILNKMPQHEYIEIVPALDSACMRPQNWQQIARCIIDNYDRYAGFIVLHGTDTMAYTAAMLSFMLGGLDKSIIFTGSQIPLGEPCSDGLNNLLIALQLVAYAQVPEVCIYFANQLFRGNRASKISTSSMIAFASNNYPILATFENQVKLYQKRWLKPERPQFNLPTLEEGNVAVIYLTPGMPCDIIQSAATGIAKGLILVSYGSGNIPTDNKPLIQALETASANNIIMVNISQCPGGHVSNAYATSRPLAEIGVIGGQDMTIEAATTKLYYLLASNKNKDKIRKQLGQNLRGEMTIDE